MVACALRRGGQHREDNRDPGADKLGAAGGSMGADNRTLAFGRLPWALMAGARVARLLPICHQVLGNPIARG